jgi:hypothetical protein
MVSVRLDIAGTVAVILTMTPEKTVISEQHSIITEAMDVQAPVQRLQDMVAIGAHTLNLKHNLIWAVQLLALPVVEMDSTIQVKHVILDMELVEMDRLVLVVHLHALLVVATHAHGVAIHLQAQAHALFIHLVEMDFMIQVKHAIWAVLTALQVDALLLVQLIVDILALGLVQLQPILVLAQQYVVTASMILAKPVMKAVQMDPELVQLHVLLIVVINALGLAQLLQVQVLALRHVVMVSMILARHVMKVVQMMILLDHVLLHALLIVVMNALGLALHQQVQVLVQQYVEMDSMILAKSVMKVGLMDLLEHVQVLVLSILIILAHGLALYQQVQALAKVLVVMDSMMMVKNAIWVTLTVILQVAVPEHAQ